MQYIDVNGTTLAYRETGSGTAAVFLHGFPLDHRMWVDQLAALGDVRHCVAPDLRGFGRSEPLAEDHLSMELLADDVAALVQGLGYESADIVSLSMGGYVALALWERHPTLVRSLALMDTRSGADTESDRAGRRETADLVVAHGRDQLFANLREALLPPHAPLWAAARLRGMIESVTVDTIVAALEGMARRPDRTALLESIDVPALVLVGAEDRLTPPEVAEHMAGIIPGAELVVVPGAGHLPPVETPGAVAEALRQFWERAG